MKQLYKIFYLLPLIGLSIFSNSFAQEIPTPNAPKQLKELPAPPMPPVIITFDRSKWDKWGEDVAQKFDDKKWEAWGEKLGKSFEGFGDNFKDMDLACADLDKKLSVLNQRLKAIKIPALPELPALPEIPATPKVVILPNCNWKLGAPSQDAVEKIKKLTKSYPVNNDDVLAIGNSYGKITVNTWNKSEIKVDVEIKAYASNDEEAQKLLDGVTVSNNKTGNQIIFKTTIEQKNNKSNWLTMSFWNAGGGDKQKVDVYYTVYMPAKNSVNFKTNYTNILLPNLSGNVGISMNYGDLNAGRLTGMVNKISSNYAKINVDALSNTEMFSNYGDIRIDLADGINASLNYCNIDLGNLSGIAVLKMNYAGGFKIGSFDKNFKSLNINSNYSNINLDFNNNSSFNFDVATTYANFKYNNDNVTITSKSPADESKKYSPSKNYKGYYGKSPSGNIVIKSNYGGVKFN
ncbi:hypothetical protein I5M32_15535 [Pedobacter sp. SD-b]|uniref:DUF4097 domain-containing protein n=1 Tax=Pedobacter segetis TaxID=2793069 RepID=A0ABS1BNA3_9SPHI|nr:DUF4097 family beta strand repeat-containing protein [Pedobacter segetis]MBK0384379.1 hypothetical protein [Pedobacter segetis]